MNKPSLVKGFNVQYYLKIYKENFNVSSEGLSSELLKGPSVTDGPFEESL